MGVKSKQRSKARTQLPQSRPRKTWSRWLTGAAVQYYLIYAIYQYLWTCPGTADENSPLACRAGDTAKEYLQPYAQPYYDQYLAEYVDQATPYVKTANAKYVAPATQYASTNFDTYGRPHYEQAKKIATEEYSRVVAPRIQAATKEGEKYYNKYAAQHVGTAQKLYKQYTPHVIQAATVALAKAHPVYIATLPYAEVALKKGVEMLSWATIEGKGWVEQRWGMHVEPQLWRIQERLGKKSDHLGTSIKNSDSSPSVTSNPNASSDSNIPPVPVHMTPEVRSQIEADLESWSSKFTAGGEKAIQDVQAKLDALCQKVTASEGPQSATLLSNLDDLIARKFEELKAGIKSVAAGPGDAALKKDKLTDLTHDTGVVLRDETLKVRTYSQTFLAEAYDETAGIVDEALEGMDSVHDLGMQELGMKWAWMEGVTYKDWARYHDLKKTFSATKQSVIRAGQGHKGLREITDFADGIEDAANKRAETAAAELATVRRIGKAKIESGEIDDTWVDPLEPVTQEGVTQPDYEALEKANLQAHEDEVSRMKDLGHEIDNHGHVVGDDSHAGEHLHHHHADKKTTEEYQEENRIGEQQEYEASLEKTPVVETPEMDAPVADVPVVEKPVEEPVSHIKELEHEIDNHGHVVGDDSPLGEKIYHHNVDEKTPQEYQQENIKAENEAAQGEEEEVEIEKNSGSGSIFVQAALKPRKVNPPQKSASGYVDSAADAASVASSSVASAWAEASRAVSQAIYGATPTGTASVASLASDKYSSALSAASVALYGTPQPATASIASVVGEQYSSASGVVADSLSSASSVAGETYQSAAAAAGDKYSQAVYAASVAIYGTPTPVYQSYASAVTDTAEAKYLEMKALVSELISGREPDFTESVMARFSSQWYTQPTIVARATDAVADSYSSAASLAGEGYASASSVGANVYGTVAGAMMTPPPAIEFILAAVSTQVNDAVAAASVALYGTEKGTVEKASSAAASVYTSGASAVSSAIYGRESTAAEQVQKQISEALSSARESLSIAIYGTPQAKYQSVSSVMSEKIYGTSQGTVESVTSVIAENVAQASGYLGENVGAAQAVIVDSYGSASSYVGDSAASASSIIADSAASASSVIASINSRVTDSVSVAFYGKEKTYAESAQARLEAAVESARVQLSTMFLSTELSFGEKASITVASVLSEATSVVGEAFSTVAAYGDDVLSSASSAGSGVYDAASSVIASGYDTAASAVSEVYDSAASAGNVAYDSAASVGSVVSDGAASVASSVSSVVVPSSATSTGLVESLSSAASTATSKIKSQASSIRNEL